MLSRGALLTGVEGDVCGHFFFFFYGLWIEEERIAEKYKTELTKRLLFFFFFFFHAKTANVRHAIFSILKFPMYNYKSQKQFIDL